jgi:transposase InsO family protein
VEAIGIDEVKTAPGSPWQNAYCERVIGTLRRECTDYIIPLNEKHLLRVLKEYVAYYNTTRTHLSLDKDAPEHRPSQSPEDGDNIVSNPVLGGLHHRYERVPSRNAA